GEIQILDPKGRELEKYDVPDGAEMKVEDGQMITRGTMLCEWDPHNIPILAEVGGKIRYEDIVEGETMRVEIDPSGHARRTIMEPKGELHPQILIEDAEGHILAYNYIPEGAGIEVQEGQMITAGTLLAKTPREVGGTQDITGGLPRVTELFEARRPKEPAVIAQIDGRVELLQEERRGKRTTRGQNASTWSPTASPSGSTAATASAPATPWSRARWCRTTSSGSRARRPSSGTCSARSRTSIAPSASRSTTSTSRSSWRRCSARSGSR